MSKEIYISSTPHETRLAIVEDEALTEIYYERENEYTLAGSIYNGRVTRVLPGMQSSFVDIGLERDAFLYITDFLEEAPDAEEFDTVTNGDRTDRPPRAPRPAGEEDASGVRTESGPRSDRERGGRGRRGGRDRNRDRGPNRDADRSPNRDADRGPDRAPDRGPDHEPLPAYADADALAPPSAELTEGSEVGEAAPGADGSRRWRGRRGRRRGRGSAPRVSEPAQQSGAPVPDSADDPAFGSPAFESKESFEIEGVAQASAPPPDRTSDRTPDRFRHDGPRGERPRRDGGRDGRPRGDNSRDGQRSNFGPRDRDQRPDRPQRVPRGFAPSRSLYGVDSDEASTGPIPNAYPDIDAGVGAEPIILPGESLSKYRRGEEPAASAASPSASDATPIPLAPPANLYTVAAGWDGGDVLPGESLSRRSSASSRSDSRPEPRSRDFDRNSRDDSRRDSRPRNDRDRGGRSDRDARGHRAENRADNRPSFRNEAATSTPAAAAQSLPSPTTGVEPPPIPHELAEYEPHTASASYRVDPLPRTEYRQSAPVLEPPAAEPETAAPAVEPAAASTEAHDITSISSAGEMLSEHVELAPGATPHPAPIEPAEPASPIRHERAVVSPEHDFDEQPIVAAAFSPGAGRIAEEIIDDEDSDITIHASSIEEIDDLDEETLEGAADLGTMLREMSIDHITRTSPETEEEEDDLEEDELDEDDLEEDELDEEEEDDEEEAREGFEIDDRPDLGQTFLSEEDQLDRTAHARDAALFEEDQAAEGSSSEERSASAPARDYGRDSERRGGRRDGRRDGRRPQRGDRGGRGDRPRSTGGSGDRDRGRSNGHGRSAQATNLPAISDLLKPGQEILVQIAKEPIAKKGARITSHIALPGRFLVFMPTVSHTGVSRKIESDAERRRLKEILLSEKGEASGGFIVRTAAEGASEEELRSDLRFLLNLWADIKARSESSKSPALIYHDLNLIERILRDQVTDNFSAIWVDTENEYERVLRFLQRFQPSLIRRVKLYTKETPLFEQFGITEEINKALRSKVWLKSGGSIVINQTEALVAIDINTGKYVGKTARLEDTIVKTNLDAIPEIVRQIRLRDLGGIIIIDFIDMDERRNRNRVMAALEEELKNDRAPSKVLQFNDFGLVAITRKRVKQSLERTLSTTCNVCVGTGMVKSPITVCNDIYVEMRKMHRHLERGDVMLRVHPEVVKQLKTSGAKWLQEMEEMVGKTILVKSDPSLHPEQFDIH
jgi:ribonuclease G